MRLRATSNACTVSDRRLLTKPTQPVRRLRRPIGLRPASPSEGFASTEQLAPWIAGEMEVSMPLQLTAEVRADCVDALDAQRPIHRHPQDGVTAVLVQARKEAAADAHHYKRTGR
jgi:hypothetical protein